MSIETQSPLSTIDTHSLNKLKNPTHPFILVLKPGESLFDSLLYCAEKINLKSASLSGLGGLDDVTVAYYNLSTKQYQTKLFTGMYELISLNGNITLVENKPFVHIHATLGNDEYNVIGGHIMSATVNPTAEITIIPFSNPIYRDYHEKTGIKMICPGMGIKP